MYVACLLPERGVWFWGREGFTKLHGDSLKKPFTKRLRVHPEKDTGLRGTMANIPRKNVAR